MGSTEGEIEARDVTQGVEVTQASNISPNNATVLVSWGCVTLEYFCPKGLSLTSSRPIQRQQRAFETHTVATACI